MKSRKQRTPISNATTNKILHATMADLILCERAKQPRIPIKINQKPWTMDPQIIRGRRPILSARNRPTRTMKTLMTPVEAFRVKGLIVLSDLTKT